MIAKFYTADEMAAVLGVSRNLVDVWRKLGHITPALTLGQLQYDRATLLQQATKLALMDVFGERSATPAKIVAANGDEFTSVSSRIEDSGWPEGEVLQVTLHAPDSEVELRVRIGEAIRERVGRVRA